MSPTSEACRENPATAAMADLRDWQNSRYSRGHGFAVIGSVGEIIEFMFGPRQHDAHVKTRTESIWLAEKAAERIRGDAALDTHMAESRERIAQALARTHGYDTKAIRREVDRYTTGCFSRDPFAATSRRQMLRALDIAIEHHGAAFAQAAE